MIANDCTIVYNRHVSIANSEALLPRLMEKLERLGVPKSMVGLVLNRPRYFWMLVVEPRTTRTGSRCIEGTTASGSRIFRSNNRLLCTPI
jgi:hypothetical protein